MKAFLVLLLAAAAITAGDVRLDRPLPVGSTDAAMQYDDGTAYWFSFAGSIRGVWFSAEDFYGSGITQLLVDNLEFWFYHHSSYPWDTASFLAELWNGDEGGVVTQLDQTSVTAVHYAPCYAYYSTSIQAEADFWALENASVMSGGGWPSVLSDGTPNPVNHSFYLSDEYIWEPLITDFFIRADAAPPGWALDQATWASIKTLF